MPNTKEKLIELLRQSEKLLVVSVDMDLQQRKECVYSQLADHLIANGVTVQQWISVKDRLPTAEDALLDSSVFAYTKAKQMLVLHYQYVCRRSDYILCWMPIAMPQPPKEVE